MEEGSFPVDKENLHRLLPGIAAFNDDIRDVIKGSVFQAGEEFARTKQGDENSYRSSPEANCLDWERKEDFKDLTEYYRGLIALRGEIGLYMIQTPQVPSRVEVTKAKDRVVVIRMDNRNTGKTERWQELFIVCNSGKRSVQEKLPEGKWEKLVDKSSSWHWKKQSIWSRMKKAGGSAGVTGSTIVIYGRKEG